jgi:hypothetical protein
MRADSPTVKMPILLEDGFAEPTSSAIVVATGTGATEASVMAGRSSLSAPLRLIQGTLAKKGRMVPFRYALFVPRGKVCIRQVVGSAPGGVLEFETPLGKCRV